MIQILQDGQTRYERAWDGSPVGVAALLHEAGFYLEAPCGGRGKCGKCRVFLAGNVSAPAKTEQALLTDAELAAGVRLACAATVTGPDAFIRLDAARDMSGELYGAGAARALRPWGERLGLAVDIGTTTVAAYLFDLMDGKPLGAALRENPQRAFGADVITRFEHALGGSAGALTDAIRGCISGLAAALCRSSGHSPADIDAAVLTGNTAMLYFLCGYDIGQLARYPFAAGELFGRFQPAAGLFDGWRFDCRIYLPRCISAYVGADISCAILASGLPEADGIAMLADIGTNGELVFKSGSRLLCCSTAAGPAFEGAGIEKGGCAVRGAVDAVWREPDGLGFHVIGDGRAASLCGSGALDLLACLLQNGDVDESGFLDCRDAVDGRSVRRLTDEVWFTQKDVRALQLAKAAIRAGIETLVRRGGAAGSVDALYLAGGFGSRLHIESALAVGLLPPWTRGKIHPVGNAAGMGAVRLLLDRDALAVCAALAAGAETLPLAEDPVFTEQFIEQMSFKEGA